MEQKKSSATGSFPLASELEKVLNTEQIQMVKDTVIYSKDTVIWGQWGDSEDSAGNPVLVAFTNDLRECSKYQSWTGKTMSGKWSALERKWNAHNNKLLQFQHNYWGDGKPYCDAMLVVISDGYTYQDIIDWAETPTLEHQTDTPQYLLSGRWKSLDEFLVEEVGVAIPALSSISPREKLRSWLVYNNIFGFTDDIICAIEDAWNVKLKQ